MLLAGFYKQDLGFAFAPACMREVQIRISAQWKNPDLRAVAELVASGALSLDGLITTPSASIERARPRLARLRQRGVNTNLRANTDARSRARPTGVLIGSGYG